MNPLVSIVVPVYNRFEYAHRAIESIFRQTYTNWELLIIDDFSNDSFELGDWLLKVPNRIELFRNLENYGPGISRQVGLDNANGDFVCFLDSDDYYHEEFVVKMLKNLEENSNCSGAYCTSFDVVENMVRRNSNLPFFKIMPTLFDKQRPWSTCSWLWRKECLPKWSSERSNEDFLFEINVAMINNNIVHVNEVLCYIDKGTGSNNIDLLGSRKNEMDRNMVVQFCIKNLSKFRSDHREIGEACLRRLLYVSARLLKYGERAIVGENIKLLQENGIYGKQYMGVWFLKVGVCLSLVDRFLGFKFLEWISVNSKEYDIQDKV